MHVKWIIVELYNKAVSAGRVSFVSVGAAPARGRLSRRRLHGESTERERHVTQRASSDFRLVLHWSLRCQAASIALGSHQLVQQSASALDGLVFGLVLREVDALRLTSVLVTKHELRRLSRNKFDLAVRVLIDATLALDPRLDVGVLVQLSSGA